MQEGRGREKCARPVLELFLTIFLIFSPIYLSILAIGLVASHSTREFPALGVVLYFAVVPVVWILASEFLGIFARILGATMVQGGHGAKYLGEALGNLLCVTCLAIFERVYFSDFPASFASAALACLLYKLAEPVCYRIFPSLKEPLIKTDSAANGWSE